MGQPVNPARNAYTGYMLISPKDLILLGISVIVTIVIGLGIALEPAIAPENTVPQIVEDTPETPQNQATSTLSQKPETESEGDVIEIPKETETPAATEPKVDPFKDLADAFADLANEQQPVSTVSANEEVRNALVNIICTTDGAGPFNPVSASGVMIDPEGVIITNAHVGQYYLLKNYPTPNFVECIIRTGSPAVPMYTSELLFIPPSWVRDNAQKIDDETPTGNGEHDYALVRITGTVNPSGQLPASFATLPVALNAPETGDKLVVAGYPAGFLGGITVQKELYAASANATIGQLYTYGGNTVDLFSIGGTVVAQQGSSGGAAADSNGILYGIIVTSSDAPDTASRDLRAISTNYIVRDFEKESGTSLENFLSGNLAETARLFNLTVAPTLSKAITNVLDN